MEKLKDPVWQGLSDLEPKRSVLFINSILIEPDKKWSPEASSSRQTRSRSRREAFLHSIPSEYSGIELWNKAGSCQAFSKPVFFFLKNHYISFLVSLSISRFIFLYLILFLFSTTTIPFAIRSLISAFSLKTHYFSTFASAHFRVFALVSHSVPALSIQFFSET